MLLIRVGATTGGTGIIGGVGAGTIAAARALTECEQDQARISSTYTSVDGHYLSRRRILGVQGLSLSIGVLLRNFIHRILSHDLASFLRLRSFLFRRVNSSLIYIYAPYTFMGFHVDVSPRQICKNIIDSEKKLKQGWRKTLQKDSLTQLASRRITFVTSGEHPIDVTGVFVLLED